MTIKRQRWWEDGKLVREILEDKEIHENLGKTPKELGINLNLKIQSEPKAIDIEKWPMWAKALKQFSKPEDAGIGDVVERMIGEDNSMAFKAWHLATFGKTCNCAGRKKRWNALYPLK